MLIQVVVACHRAVFNFRVQVFIDRMEVKGGEPCKLLPSTFLEAKGGSKNVGRHFLQEEGDLLRSTLAFLESAAWLPTSHLMVQRNAKLLPASIHATSLIPYNITISSGNSVSSQSLQVTYNLC